MHWKIFESLLLITIKLYDNYVSTTNSFRKLNCRDFLQFSDFLSKVSAANWNITQWFKLYLCQSNSILKLNCCKFWDFPFRILSDFLSKVSDDSWRIHSHTKQSSLHSLELTRYRLELMIAVDVVTQNPFALHQHLCIGGQKLVLHPLLYSCGTKSLFKH